MNLYPLLFSRSLSKDYRWMVCPQWIATNDLRKLRQLYDGYDIYKAHKSLIDAPIPMTFCLNLPSMTVLGRCSPTSYTDQYSRQIFCLVGLAVQSEYARHLWFSLPWLLQSHETIFNIWANIDFEKADNLSKSPLATREISLDEISEPILSTSIEVDLSKALTLEYTKIGYEKLKSIVASPNLPLVDFIFGATPAIVNQFSSWRILAQVGEQISVPQTQLSPYSTSTTYPYQDATLVRDETKSDAIERQPLRVVIGEHIDIKTYDFLCLEWGLSGVYIYSRMAVLKKLVGQLMPIISENYPNVKANISPSSIEFDEHLYELRIHRLNNQDKKVGMFLATKWLQEQEWKPFEYEDAQRNQFWFRRFKSLL